MIRIIAVIFLRLSGIKTDDIRFYREVSHLMIKNLADEDKAQEVIAQDWFESQDQQID